MRTVPRRPRRSRPELTPEQLHERALHRAWACGERYRRRLWRRRPPPRFRPRGCFDAEGVATSRAFYRGYDQMSRSINRRRALWREQATWSEEA